MVVPSLSEIEETIKTLVLALDLAGTFAFALSGAVAGSKRHLDLFGVLVLSFVAACSGGIPLASSIRVNFRVSKVIVAMVFSGNVG